MKTILLKFSAPLQSWGARSHFDTRQTDAYPSKSGVIGLLAASLGYRRADERVEKLNELMFGVRIDQEGTLVRDFQTVTKEKDELNAAKYVTNRYYLQDAVFVVALSHDEDVVIDEILEALQKPFFGLFLGRRACPVTSDLVLGVKEMGVIDSLKDYPWQAMEWRQRRAGDSVRLTIYADHEMMPNATKLARNDRVISFSQENRRMSPRFESRMEVLVQNPQNQTEHDAFEAIGE